MTRGAVIVSRLANWHQDRFIAFAWPSVPYWPPSTEALAFEELIAQMRAQWGSDTFGYWLFFNRDDAYLLIRKNVSAMCP